MDLRVLLAVYVVTAVAATISKLARGTFEADGFHYLQLPNFALFRNSFFHLIHGQNLYTYFPLEQWGAGYRYSPAFALLMAPIAVMPYSLGAMVWNLINAMAIFVSVRAIPGESDRKKAFILWFVLVSLTISMQNAQSNGLIAGLMIGSWVAQERNKPGVSSLFIALSVFIKLFGVLALLPCLLCRGRRKLIGYTMIWISILAAVPLAVVRPGQLMLLYRNWYEALLNDHAASVGRSAMGLLQAWFHQGAPERAVVLAGAAILAVVLLIRRDAHQDQRFRLLAVASVLIWVVIFNHMAESPTMIIAVAGIAMWYYFQSPTLPNAILMGLTFAFTCLLRTDVVPRAVSARLLPLYFDVAPCVLVWLKLQVDLLRFPAPKGRETPIGSL